MKLSYLWAAPEINPINGKARSIPVLNVFNVYGRVFFFSWFGFSTFSICSVYDWPRCSAANVSDSDCILGVVHLSSPCKYPHTIFLLNVMPLCL